MNKTRHSKKLASPKSKSLENIKSFLNNSGWIAKLETEAKDRQYKDTYQALQSNLRSFPEEQKMSDNWLEKRWDFQLIIKLYFQDIIINTILYCQPSNARE